MAHPEIGEKVMQKLCEDLEDVATLEAPLKMFGRSLIAVLAPGAKKKREPGKEPSKEVQEAENS